MPPGGTNRLRLLYYWFALVLDAGRVCPLASFFAISIREYTEFCIFEIGCVNSPRWHNSVRKRSYPFVAHPLP